MDGITLLSIVTAVASVVLAVVALWVAFVTLRKTTEHLFRVVEASSGKRMTVRYPKGFYQFDLYIKNLGLPFPKMSVVLSFRPEDGPGTLSHSLSAIDIMTDASTPDAENVATGLVVKFGLRSHEIRETDAPILCMLKDVRRQGAWLSVYCGGYLVRTIYLDSIRERLKRRYRYTVLSVARRLQLGFYAKRAESWQARFPIPRTMLLPDAVTAFIRNLRSTLPPEPPDEAEKQPPAR